MSCLDEIYRSSVSETKNIDHLDSSSWMKNSLHMKQFIMFFLIAKRIKTCSKEHALDFKFNFLFHLQNKNLNKRKLVISFENNGMRVLPKFDCS